MEAAAGEDSGEATGKAAVNKGEAGEGVGVATGEATGKVAVIKGEAGVGVGNAGGTDSSIAGRAAVVLDRRSANRRGQAFDLIRWPCW